MVLLNGRNDVMTLEGNVKRSKFFLKRPYIELINYTKVKRKIQRAVIDIMRQKKI